jgi:hypothetical protein
MQKSEGPVLALAALAVVGVVLAGTSPVSATEAATLVATATPLATTAAEPVASLAEVGLGGWTGAPSALLLLLLAGLAAAMERVR